MTLYTANYNLAKYEGSDKPNLRDQYNSAMDLIDHMFKSQEEKDLELSQNITSRIDNLKEGIKVVNSDVQSNATEIDNLKILTNTLKTTSSLNNLYLGRINIINADFDPEKTFKRLDPIHFSFAQSPNSDIYPTVTYPNAVDSPFSVVSLIPNFFNQDGNVIIENISLKIRDLVTAGNTKHTYSLLGGIVTLTLVKYDYAGSPASLNGGIYVVAGSNVKTKY